MISSKTFKRNQSELLIEDPRKPGKFARREPTLEDEDKMPFGKYEGVMMRNVPASYLMWLYENKCNNMKVANYIWNNFDAINDELPEDSRMIR